MSVTQGQYLELFRKMESCVEQLQYMFPNHAFDTPTLNTNIKSKRTVGQFRRKHHEVRLNPEAIAFNYDAILNDVIPHEMAHYGVCVVYRYNRTRVKAHGYEWKAIASKLGAVPRPITNAFYGLKLTAGRIAKPRKRYVYDMGAVGEITIGGIQHKRIQSGNRFYKYHGEDVTAAHWTGATA